MKTEKVLITGAGGFIGTHLESFLKLKNLNTFTLGTKRLNDTNHFVLKNLEDLSSIKETLKIIKPDYFFHLAGSTDTSNPLEIFKINTLFCRNILDAIQEIDSENKIKVMIVGSSAEYGLIEENENPVHENKVPKPSSLYGISKLAQTHIAESHFGKDKKITIVRPFNILGVGMPKNFAVKNFLNQIKKLDNKETIKTGNLETQRDFIDVRDAVILMWEIINNKKSYGKVINLCSGRPIEIREILSFLLEESKKDLNILSIKDSLRKDDSRLHYGDNSLLCEIVGEYDFIPWKESIRNILKNE